MKWPEENQGKHAERERRKEHYTSLFFFFTLCQETAAHITSTFYRLALRRNFCICVCYSFFFCVYTAYWCIGLLRSLARHEWRRLKWPPESKGYVGHGKQKWNTFSTTKILSLLLTTLINGVCLNPWNSRRFLACMQRARMCKNILIIAEYSFRTLWLTSWVWQKQLWGCQWASWIGVRQEHGAPKGGPRLTNTTRALSRSLSPLLLLCFPSPQPFRPVLINESRQVASVATRDN